MMTSLRRQKKNRILYPFSLIVLISSILLLVFCLVALDAFSLNIIKTYSVNELSQIGYSTDFMFENAKSLLTQYMANPSVLKLMNYDQLSDRQTSELFFTVSQIDINTSLKNQLLIYNKKAGKIYDNTGAYPVEEYYDQDLLKYFNDCNGIRKLYPYPREVKNDYINSMQPVYTFFLYDGNKREIDGAVILNMSQDWLKDTIYSMNSSSQQEILVTDADGKVVIENSDFPYLGSLRECELFRSVFSNEADSGCYVQSSNGQKYMVSFVVSGPLNWKFIRVTPYRAVVGRYQKILIIIAVIVLSFTLLSLIVTLLFSNRISLLFNKKIKEIEKKYQPNAHAFYIKKQENMRKILFYDLGRMQVSEILAQSEINFNLSESFVFVLFSIDNYRKYCKCFSTEDRELFSYGIINIINELAEPYFPHEAVAVDRSSIGLILNMKIENFQTTAVLLDKLVGTIQCKIKDYIGISFSAVIGKILEDFSEIPLSFEMCREALKYRFFSGMNSLIYVSNVEEIQKQSYPLPEKNINCLVDQLMLGKQSEAKDLYLQIITEGSQYSYTYFQMTVSQLSLCIKSAVERQSALLNRMKCSKYPGLDINLTAFDSVKTLNDVFFHLFGEICNEIQQVAPNREKTKKYFEFISEINDFIQMRYADPRLSPDLIAENFSISSEYLRRLYKKISNVSLSEYITKCRLEKACDYLQKTDNSIGRIAEGTGFTNINYFYSIFKKYYQITPNEYRRIQKG